MSDELRFVEVALLSTPIGLSPFSYSFDKLKFVGHLQATLPDLKIW